MENFGISLDQPPVVLVEPPPEIQREFSAEFKKARKKFGKLVEEKIDAAKDKTRGLNGDKETGEASRLIEQMKFLESVP